MRYLTKSRFKLACECPAKLFYTGKPEYSNQKVDDPFLLALAKGGFQVGELAAAYHPEGQRVSGRVDDYKSLLDQTGKLLRADGVTLFEAAVAYENYFIRVDILKKDKDQIELIEVKSNSYHEEETKFGGRDGIISKWRPRLYDIAFQKYVVQKAYPEHTVSAYLMLVDKGSVCPTDGLHQKFKIKTNSTGANMLF